MTQPSTNTPSRNAPCPCGSGKKSKRCCGVALPAKKATEEVSARQPWLLVVGLLGVIAIAVYTVSQNLPAVLSGTAKPPPAGISSPRPWQYDAASDQHWDPAHKHWHDGRPPVSAGGANVRPPVSAAKNAPSTPTTGSVQAAPTRPPAPSVGIGATPKPWQYDATKNRVWDPVHQHWHDGPPLQAPGR